MENVRNFCIIAHIDHGKSTLADRLIELTGTVEKRDMKHGQLLDTMDLEQERGITIKLQPVRMTWKNCQLNLIDTPGHADFQYEVSRSLSAVEGAILVVDATQGIEAQTLANLYSAIELDLKIIPVLNKIDLPAADPERVKDEIENILSIPREEVIEVSAKEGTNCEAVLDAIVERVPTPRQPEAIAEDEMKALIFDSVFDPYRGVVIYVRNFSGEIKKGDKLKLLRAGSEFEALEVGCFKPKYSPTPTISKGEIGYIITGLKSVRDARVGETVWKGKKKAPTKKDSNAKILFLGGTCGSGKTTIAEMLAKKLGWTRIAGDEIAKQLGFEEEKMLEPQQVDDCQKVYEEILRETKKSVASGKNVVIEYIFSKTKTFQKLKTEFAENFEIKILHPSVAVASKRNKNRECWTSAENHVVDLHAAYENLKSEIGAENFIDTSNETADETFEKHFQSSESDSPVPLPGYKKVSPFVFAGVFSTDADDYPRLRDALEKLSLNDSALTFEPEQSGALGFGFRVSFLGLLHLEIVQERLEREYDLDLIVTAPSVKYEVVMPDGEVRQVNNPSELPEAGTYEELREPWVRVEIVVPKEFLGGVLELASARRGMQKNLSFIDADRALAIYELPLASIVTDFYDRLKNVSSGYASMNYEHLDFRAGDLVKLDILVAGEPIDALSFIAHRSEARSVGMGICKNLKEIIPRANFVIPIQAAIGSQVIARETLSAFRKDVTAKLYGGDVTRKNKLLKKQKAGKKRAKQFGKVTLPQEAFLAVLKRD